jgi:branched-chain amino acid transport system ATP-binding protein
LLEVEEVFSGYGTIEVLRGVSLSVGDERIVSIIGGNGAGKSTLLHTISGLLPASRGKIVFNNRDITRMRPHIISSLGLVQVPEGRQIFGPLTVYENLLLGCYGQRKSLGKSGIKEGLDKIFKIYPILSRRKNQVAGTLSGGEQQMLAIGRALMSEPRLLLLDEPSQGLAPLVVKELGSILQDLNREGLPIMLVEQNASLALALARYAYVLSMGEVAAEGITEDLENNPKVKEIYLGKAG